MTLSAVLLSHRVRQAREPLPRPRVVRTTLYEMAEALQQAYPDLDDRELAEMMVGLLGSPRPKQPVKW